MINLELHETTAISSLPSSAQTLEAKTDEGSATPRLPCSSFPPVRSLISSKNSRCYLQYISLTFYCYIGLSLPWRAVTTSVIHKDVPQFFYPDEHVLDLKNEADPLFEGYFIMNVYFRVIFMAHWQIDHVRWQVIQHTYTASSSVGHNEEVLGIRMGNDAKQTGILPSPLVPSYISVFK